MPTDVLYTPGDWLAIASAGRWLLVEKAVDDPSIGVLFTTMRDAGEPTAVLTALLADGFTGLPGFVLVDEEGPGLRCFGRGPARLAIDDVPVTLTGTLSWLEVVTPRASRLVLSCPTDGLGELTLPLASGVTTAARIVLEMATSAGGRPTADPRESILPPPATVSVDAPDDTPVIDSEVQAQYLHLLTAATGFHQPAAPPSEPEPAEQPAPPANEATPAGVTATWQDQEDAAESTTPDAEPAAAVSASAGPMVEAVLCPVGHPSPPASTDCRQCGARIASADTSTVPRPVLGHLRLSTGTEVRLDRGAVFGRAPQTSVVDAVERPHLVRLANAHEISRIHASVRIEDWTVLLQDLGSANGTFVIRPGEPPERVRPQHDVPIYPGTRVSLADAVELVYEIESP